MQVIVIDETLKNGVKLKAAKISAANINFDEKCARISVGRYLTATKANAGLKYDSKDVVIKSDEYPDVEGSDLYLALEALAVEKLTAE